jgi:hypothetical protein
LAQQSKWRFSGAYLTAALWTIQIILSPIYVFDSGLPQPADVLMVFIALLVVVFHGITIPAKAMPLVRVMLTFVAYTALANGWWYLQLGDAALLVPPVYYLYNTLVLAVFWSLYVWLGNSLIAITAWSIVLSILLQTLASLQLSHHYLNTAFRATLFFKNPNQTAYYAVLAGSLLVTCARANQLPSLLRILSPLLFVGLIYITALTQSRAGLAAVTVLIAIFAIRRISTAVILGAILFVAAHSSLAQQLMEVVAERLEQKQTNFQEELAYRGYARLWQNSEFLLFGAGEGAYERFEALWGKELHSTFGNVLMSYGFVGLALLLWFFWKLVRTCGIEALIAFLPPFLYGLTHNGIRQSEFWLLAGLSVCLVLEQSRPRVDSYFRSIHRPPRPFRYPFHMAGVHPAIGNRHYQTRGL